jgi:hypothetical protein
MDDVVFRVLPLTDIDVSEMVKSARAERLLRGYRGSPPADIPAVERLLLQLAALGEAAPRISEIDLNPVIVHQAGEGITLIDARVRLNSSERQRICYTYCMQTTSWSFRILSLLALSLCVFLISIDSTIAAPKKSKAHASGRKRTVKKHPESKSKAVASSRKTPPRRDTP